MTELGSPHDTRSSPTDRTSATGRVLGWILTGLGILAIAVTAGVSLYFVVTAPSATESVRWIFIMLFFAAFPALMGLGLIIWGGALVRRSRTGLPQG